MVAGFNTPTTGKVQLGSKPITQPGPDRMVVFQNYAPLPWRTAFENIYIAVNAVYPNKSKAEKTAIVREHTGGTGDAADKSRRNSPVDETAGFDRTSFGDSSQSLDSG